MTRTTALLFDLDDTLLADEASSDAALLAACMYAGERHNGLDVHSLALAVGSQARRLWRASATYAYCHAIGISAYEGLWGSFGGDDPNLRALRAWVGDYRRETWQRALEAHGMVDAALAGELAEMFQRERRARQIVYPDVVPALEQLTRTHRLALVTNGAPDLQREKIVASGLAGYFEAIVVSGELGIGKPEPRIFTHALELVGARPEAALMVGDSLWRDVMGAQRVGMRGIWINRLGQRIPDGSEIVPDGTIAELGELVAFL
ncbi:MAG TPA: HAD family hydrolase [Ktedonobacterales bacterium]